MLNSSHEEYKMMFEVEERLWWYKILHEKVLGAIQHHHGQNKTIKILDIGCGTGGLLLFLQKNGYTHIQGVDYSDSSIFFCQKRQLSVQKVSADQVSSVFTDEQFDVIVCNDVLYCLEKQQIRQTLIEIGKLLKPQGVFVSNNNAFDAFYGTHDIAVGGKHRFTVSSFSQYLPQSLAIRSASYWSVLLSPLILAVRFSQQIQLKLGLIDPTKIVSDVSLPANWLNNFFYQLVKLEEQLLKKGFFGSSLFLTLSKTT